MCRSDDFFEILRKKNILAGQKKSVLIGIGIVEKTGNASRDFRAAKVVAVADLAKQIKVRVKEEMWDYVCEKREGPGYEECEKVIASRSEEFVDCVIKGVEVVEKGERGKYAYVVVSLERGDAVDALKRGVSGMSRSLVIDLVEDLFEDSFEDRIEPGRGAEGETGVVDEKK